MLAIPIDCQHKQFNLFFNLSSFNLAIEKGTATITIYSRVLIFPKSLEVCLLGQQQRCLKYFGLFLLR